MLRTVQFIAIVLTALALVPAGAHFFEFWNKMALTADQYFIVQNIYRGWALFGFVLIGAFAANVAAAVLLWGQGAAFGLAAAAAAAILLNLAVFFGWTYPVNAATENWTQIPDNWEPLRAQWEYSHAVNAVVMFVAFCSITLASLLTRGQARR